LIVSAYTNASSDSIEAYHPRTLADFAAASSNACLGSLGIDPAYGSSSFGILVTQFVDGQVQFIRFDATELLTIANRGNNFLWRSKL
jgi:hypothetical protein